MRKNSIYIAISLGFTVILTAFLPLIKTQGCWSGETSYITSDATFTGEATSQSAGRSIACVGDVNGDGFEDFVVGAPYYNNSKGRVYLFYGRNSSTQIQGNYILTQADLIFTGKADYSYFGYSVAGAGDVNNDGFDDILIGAYGYSSYAGCAYLFYGGNALISGNSEDANFTGGPNYYAGMSVAGVGDVNGDGFDDFLIGAYGYLAGTGRTYLFYGGGDWSSRLIQGSYSLTNAGNANATFTGKASGVYSGQTVAGVGDVNADGLDDFLIGDPIYSYEGEVYLFYGMGSGYLWTNDHSLDQANATFWSNQWDDYAGLSLAGAGDVNNDGFDDILIGSRDSSYEYRGCISLFYGGNSSTRLLNQSYGLFLADVKFIGEASGEQAGLTMNGAGNVNRDEWADIIIGTSSNKAYLIYGRGNFLGTYNCSQADLKFSVESSGYICVGAGDVNGDGFRDILIGAPTYDNNKGRTYLFYNWWADNTNGKWQNLVVGYNEITCSQCHELYCRIECESFKASTQVKLTTYKAGSFPEIFEGGLTYITFETNDPTGIQFPATAYFYYNPALLGPEAIISDLKVYSKDEGGHWIAQEGQVKETEYYIVVLISGPGSYVIASPLPLTIDPQMLTLIVGISLVSVVAIGMLRMYSVGGMLHRRKKKLARIEARIRHLIAFQYAAERVLEEVKFKDIEYGV